MTRKKVNNNFSIYRCPRVCMYKKHCFILKTEAPLGRPIVVMHKCKVLNKDIRVVIGDEDTD